MTAPDLPRHFRRRTREPSVSVSVMSSAHAGNWFGMFAMADTLPLPDPPRLRLIAMRAVY